MTCSLPPKPPPTSGAMTRSLCSGDAGDHRQHQPQDVRDLGRGPQRVVVALRLDDGRAGLHERRDEPLLDEPPADDDVGIGEGLVGVRGRARLTAVEDEAEAGVGGQVGVEEVRRLPDRLLHVQHGGSTS